jgi:hypothetical protein
MSRHYAAKTRLDSIGLRTAPHGLRSVHAKHRTRLFQDDASGFDAIFGKRLAVVEEFDLAGRRDALSLRLTYDAIERNDNSMRMVSHHRIGRQLRWQTECIGEHPYRGRAIPQTKAPPSTCKPGQAFSASSRLSTAGKLCVTSTGVANLRRFPKVLQVSPSIAQPYVSERIAGARSGAAPGWPVRSIPERAASSRSSRPPSINRPPFPAQRQGTLSVSVTRIGGSTGSMPVTSLSS